MSEAQLDAFLAAINWRLVPAYLLLSICVGWLGLLTTIVLAEGYLSASLDGFGPAVQILMFVAAAVPFLFAIGDVAGGEGS